MDSKLIQSFEELEKLFSSRMSEYEDKLLKATAVPDPAHSDISTLSRDFTDFKSFVYRTMSHLKTQIELLSLGLDRHETVMRRKILLFHGIAEKPNEKLNDTILKIFSKQLKIDEIHPEHLDVCHRLGSSQGKTRPVLVRFINMDHRRLAWDSKTSLKGSGITVSEFLTKTRHQVFMAGRKHFSVNNCWSAEGKIVVLTPDKTRCKISSMGELEKLMALYPACSTTPQESEAAVNTSPAKATGPSPQAAPQKAKVSRRGRR
uniref:Uncharacterized protein n=1 Tax=Heliothis virescens TaxID=7102 RepID=A0A2A4JNA4_HELVI